MIRNSCLYIIGNGRHRNKPDFGQIVKSPKLYFTETGLAAYLLGLENVEQVSRDPLRGLLFENLVVMDAFKTRFNRNKDANLFYLRTAKGVEVDLILKSKSSLFPLENNITRQYVLQDIHLVPQAVPAA